MTKMDAICGACGLTFGSHRADGIVHNQCPEHEGAMDWPGTGVTIFIDSGNTGIVPDGTPRHRPKVG